MASKPKQIPVLITTAHKGVFFGYIDPAKRHNPHIDMTNVRNCIMWSSSVGGFLGLASTGPNKDCRIGALVQGIFTARDVTAVVDCAEAAVKAWEGAPCHK
jgi:hypothetical protein